MSNGVVAVGQGASFFTLKLQDGKLRVHSSMLQELEGVSIGDNLNDTNWQKIYLAFNSSDLVISLNDKYTAKHRINPIDETHTAFNMTYIGGIPRNSSTIVLVRPYEEFIGCIQDMVVNGLKVREDTSDDEGVVKENISKGCSRSV